MNNLKKNDKRIETAIVKALNDVCDSLKLKYDGFSWLTHFAKYGHDNNYSNFPQSLKIVFVFDNAESLNQAKNNELFKTIFGLTESRLKRESVTVKHIDKAVFFDTEENGADFNKANWCRKYS